MMHDDLLEARAEREVAHVRERPKVLKAYEVAALRCSGLHGGGLSAKVGSSLGGRRREAGAPTESQARGLSTIADAHRCKVWL